MSPRRWLVELSLGPAGDVKGLRERLTAAGAALVPTFRPLSLPGPRGTSLVWLVELAAADEARVRALPEFVGMVPDLAIAPSQSRE
jgi:hypothetical protein